ncbi:primosomal protein DnaI [Bacillus carboniphilus]|uniref:Primosomal protein DnaI n=1 Tax=Bacillus carboniphilus TaxID=86663 RepID=A0ABY9JXN5_9BACI|nr:primosomal protein DnaI [Bacillus carboniphilus]WLR44152.1 primosomal protein DnaI [Bacillus carboniphilus]
MDSIQHSLKNIVGNNNLQSKLKEMKEQLLKNDQILLFLEKEQVPEQVIEKNLVKLYEFASQSQQCSECPSLDKCKNILQGHYPLLEREGNTINIKYVKCENQKLYEKEKKQKSLVESIYIPRENLKARLNNIDYEDNSRLKAVSYVHEFLENYEPTKPIKGLYLYGAFGVGKTFILGAIANELAEKSVASVLLYVPEFVRELKTSLQNDTFNRKIEAVKIAPVLMLDDIGAESMSSWVRDDILGAILQYRMLENLPTFFTSNFDLKELEHHLAYTQRGEEEKVKAARVMERIKYLSIPIELEGENRRNQ